MSRLGNGRHLRPFKGPLTISVILLVNSIKGSASGRRYHRVESPLLILSFRLALPRSPSRRSPESVPTMSNVCCTCASIVSGTPPANATPTIDTNTEKPIDNKRLDCCGRLVCAQCIARNSRFASYCAFCQSPASMSTARDPQASPPPPAYTDSLSSRTPPPAHGTSPPPSADDPPPYDDARDAGDSKRPDTIHHLSPTDTMASLSLAYRVPLPVLRRHNSIYSDHLLTARKLVLVPGQYYQGPSLAPDPVEDEEEAERKAKIRRLMTRCKIHEYDMAVLYLEQEGWGYREAEDRFWADERWEREHPIKGKGRAGQMGTGVARRLGVRS